MDAKQWKEKVCYSPKNGYDRMSAEEREAMTGYCEGYKAFLDTGKTERECVTEAVRQAQAQGFRPFVRGMALKAGDKVYQSNRGKMLLLAVIGAVGIILTSGRESKNWFKRILKGLYGVYGVTSYLSDILSYSRLMALMLSGSVIAQVFNTLGAIPGNVVVFFIVSMAGNALNFALNLLGCYVHDLRLQCLEFFKNFYQDGGKPFRPLAVDTKYVDIQKD